MSQIPSREPVIDLLRGIVILDMILVHFDRFYPALITKIVEYTDFAIEGFIFLSGYMIGSRFYDSYLKDPGGVTKKLWIRALQLYGIYALMVLTINIPLYYLLLDDIRAGESLYEFVLNSMLIRNQLGLIHILPTFIPLFLISPLILWLFRKRLGIIIAAGSLGLFMLGNQYPYLLDFGQPTFFPFILWQIYFVAGFFVGNLGKSRSFRKRLNDGSILLPALVFFAVMMVLRHAKVVPSELISKFPLNAPGLLYGSSILFAVFAVSHIFWERLRQHALFNSIIPVLGRHSLLVFVLHVYTAKYIHVAAKYFPSPYLPGFLAAASVALIYLVIFQLEKNKNLRFISSLKERHNITWPAFH